MQPCCNRFRPRDNDNGMPIIYRKCRGIGRATSIRVGRERLAVLISYAFYFTKSIRARFFAHMIIEPRDNIFRPPFIDGCLLMAIPGVMPNLQIIAHAEMKNLERQHGSRRRGSWLDRSPVAKLSGGARLSSCCCSSGDISQLFFTIARGRLLTARGGDIIVSDDSTLCQLTRGGLRQYARACSGHMVMEQVMTPSQKRQAAGNIIRPVTRAVSDADLL